MTEARNCEKCGAELGAEASFCTSCGAHVGSVEPSSMSNRQKEMPDMIKWEYKTVRTEVQGSRPPRMRDLDPAYNESTVEWLNTLGYDGWELVSITPLNIGMGRTSGLAYLVFKRPLS